jgi:RecG-like helicase
MFELINSLSKLQKQKLVNAGFHSIYDLITYFPRTVRTIKPLTNNSSAKVSELYLFEGVLEKVEFKNGKKKYVQLSFRTPQLLQLYYFSVTNYTTKWLTPGSMFQGLITYKKGFWSAVQLAKKKSEIQTQGFVLGSANLDTYLQVIYPEKKTITNTDLINIHQLLESRFYILDLSGLVPQNDIFPLQMNLSDIHKPSSSLDYTNAYNNWLKFKVFLKLCIHNYYNQTQVAIPGKLIELDLEYTKNLVRKLPFQLTASQKTTIWEILQDLSTNY